MIARGRDGKYHHDSVTFPYVISLDCHDKSTFTKIVHVITNQTFFNHTILGHLDNVARIIEQCRIPKKKALIIYEAGSLGFYPYRFFTNAGYACKVIAPSSIPNNNRRRKTDKKDCGANLEYHLGGLLKYVTVPKEHDEEVRDSLRHRRNLTGRITKQQQRITAFTKRQGHFFDATKTNWTKSHRVWLKRLSLSAGFRAILDLMIDELDMLEYQLQKIDAVLDSLSAADPHYQSDVAAYQLLPGFGRVNAMTVVFECRDLERFSHPAGVPNFIGLIPSKSSSGNSDPHLSITKEGNAFARLALVSAAKAYGDRRFLYNQKELLTLPPVVQPFMRKLQDRLYGRYRYLKSKGKHTNKVRCAIARELCMFLWEYKVKVMPGLEQTTILKKAA